MSNHPGWHIDYRFAVAVYDVTTHWWSDPDYDLLINECDFIHGPDSTVTTRWGFEPDRAIIVAGAADILDANNQLVQTTSTADFVRNGPSNYASVSDLHQPMAVIITPHSPGWLDKVNDTWAAVRALAQQFGSHAGQLIDLLGSGEGRQRIYDVLTQSFVNALTQFGQGLPGSLGQPLANWLGINTTKFMNVDFKGVNDWGNYLLDYAGLKLDHVYDVVRSQLGDGNLIALQKAYDWIKDITPTDPNGFRTLLTNMQNTMVDLQKGAAGLDPNTFIDGLVNKIAAQVPAALARAGANFAAKFVPGMGLAISLYDGLKWVLDNQTTLAALFEQFGAVIDVLADSTKNTQQAIDSAQAKLLQGFNDSISAFLPLAATQLGLSQLPQEVKKVLSFVPAQVDAAIRKAVDTVASSLPVLPGVIGGTKKDKMFDGMLATPREFLYPDPGGKTYILWAAQDKLGAHVRIAEKTLTGYKFICDLGSPSFTAAAQQNIGQLISAARALHTASKQSTGTTNPLGALKTQQASVVTAEDLVVAAIKANACTVLNAGCFAAGTKLLTRNGWRAVETIRPGDEVLSRSEHDWSASAEWKRVEERFERTGCILHVHVGGEVIRTTPEHPFFVQGEGWKQAGALANGDRIATLSGEWVGVEEVYDTGEWEPVYNLRVADHHTYFVGDEHWGWAAWAHNRICGHHETSAAHNLSYARTGTDQPSITDPANLILKAERIARGMTPACQGDSLTLAYLQIAGDSQAPIFASNSDNYQYTFPSVAAGQVTPGQGVNSEARKHAEVKAMIRAVQEGTSLTGKALTIFTDHDPCSYCDLSRGIENAARLFGAVSVTIWCPSGRIGTISL